MIILMRSIIGWALFASGTLWIGLVLIFESSEKFSQFSILIGVLSIGFWYVGSKEK